jgi:hypothetical protein
MQAAARALVGTGDNAQLVFDAKGLPGDLLRFTGEARSGDVVVPMEVGAALHPDAAPFVATITGWARFTDVHIPLPGLSRVNTVEVDVSSRVTFVEA